MAERLLERSTLVDNDAGTCLYLYQDVYEYYGRFTMKMPKFEAEKREIVDKLELVGCGVPVGDYFVVDGYRDRPEWTIFSVTSVEDGFVRMDNMVVACVGRIRTYVPYTLLVPATPANGWVSYKEPSIDDLLKGAGVSHRSLELAREALTLPVDSLEIPHQMFIQVAQAIEKGLSK